MAEEIKRPVATKDMIRFWAECQEKSNETYRDNSKKNELLNELKRNDEKMAKAVVGYGVALSILAEQRAVVEKEIKDFRMVPHFDSGVAFKRKYGIDPYTIDFTPKLEQKDITDD